MHVAPEVIEKVNEIIRVVDDALDESSLNFLLEENTANSGYEKRKGRGKHSIRFGYGSDGGDLAERRRGGAFECPCWYPVF